VRQNPIVLIAFCTLWSPPLHHKPVYLCSDACPGPQVGSDAACRAAAERACVHHAQELAAAAGCSFATMPPIAPDGRQQLQSAAAAEVSGTPSAAQASCPPSGTATAPGPDTSPGTNSDEGVQLSVQGALRRLRTAGRQGLALHTLLAPAQADDAGCQVAAESTRLASEPRTAQPAEPCVAAASQTAQQQQQHENGQPCLRTASLVAACLLRCGLARCVPAFSGGRLMASEASQQLVVRVPPCAPGPARSMVPVCQMARGVERVSTANAPHPQQPVQQQKQQQQHTLEPMDTEAAASFPDAGTATGQGQAGQAAAAAAAGGAEGVEVPLSPWLDAEGHVNVDLLEVRCNRTLLCSALVITKLQNGLFAVWLLNSK